MKATVSSNTTATQRTEILFIESNVPDIQSLLDAVTPGTEVHILDASTDGLVQMARMLSGRSEIDAIHLISHGASGTLQLGSSNLTTERLAAYGAELKTIGNALKPGGDFLLYGCNVGEGETGAQFIGRLAQTFGADVNASTDLTGDAAQGGDWQLESSTGNIETTALNVVSYQGVLAAPVFGQGGGSYSRTDIPVFTTPPLSRIATADVNGDGKADLLVANQSTLTVLTSNGDGTLSENGLYLTGGAGIKDLTVADVNNDGEADVILVQQMTFSEFGPNKNASVLLNNGDGSFAPGIDFFTQPDATEIISADLNGDGKIDLLTKQSGDIAVQVGNGDGTFEWPVNYSVGAGSLGFLDTSTLAIADLNRDGKLDVVVTDAAGQDVSVLFNNGDGSLGSKIEYATSGHPSSTIGADVTGDGWVDLITTYEGRNSVSVKINNGDGTFAADVDYEAGHPIYVSSNVIAVEINGDASTDLVVQNFGDNTVSVLKNNGDGSFTGKTDLATGAGPVEIAGADFNGDGRIDIVTSNWLDRSLSVLLNQDNSTPTVFFKQTPVAVSPTLSLSDSDGDIDWNGGQLKIQITANSEANYDVLGLPGAPTGGNPIWLNPYGEIMAEMTPIGTANTASALGADAWLLTFNSNATNALVQDVVRAVEFFNNNETPSSLSRTVTFTATDAGGLSAIAEQTITVSAANAAALTYSPSIFTESTLNDGSIVTSSLITLSNETFTGNDGDDWSPNVHNVPAGLTPKLIRNDATHATLSFTGQAMAHANADDFNNLTVSFSDWQFTGGSAATVTGATTTNLTIDFAEPLSKILTYSATTFVESAANDGSITTTSTISLTNDTFTGMDGDDWSPNVHNVPAGLTPKLIRVDTTHATLSFTGQAMSHANADDFNNLTVSFSDWQFTGGSAATVAGATTTNLAIDFVEPLPKTLNYSATTFVESATNDGSITNTSTISLTNETFTGMDGDDWSSIVTNVPAGLTASLIRTGATHATLSFTGQAAAHTNANDLGDLTVNFDNTKFTGGSAVEVTGAATNNLSIDFTDPPVNHAPIIGQPMFATKLNYGAGPTRVISADVNSDGKADLIATGRAVSVLINTGDGIFADKVDYPVGASPEDVISADVNGDGKADLIVENTSVVKANTVSVLINNGDGSFAAKVNYNTDDGTGFETGGITSADVNSDGMADLIVTHKASDQLSVLINNGDGSFAPKVDYAAGWRSRYITSADVNNDGTPDLIMANGGRFVSVLINNGTGSFVDKVDYEVGGDAWDATSADANGDGNVDLIIVQPFNNTVSVLTNNGDGSFADRVSYATGQFPVSVTSADANGDGTADLIVANRDVQTISVLAGEGDGSFAAKTEYAVELSPQDVTSADVDGDGKPDLIVTGYSTSGYTVAVLLNSPVTAFDEQTPVSVSNAFMISDPDGDAAWSGGHLKIQITANSEANDSLSLLTANPGGNAIWLDTTGNKLMAGETQIGTADASSVSNGSAWTFTFDNDATNALVQDVARAVRFNNSSDIPGTDKRTVSFTVTDSGLLSASATQIIAVTTDIDGDGITNATENSAPGLWRDGVSPTVGDGNGDGIRDSTQNEITSVPFLVTSTPVSNPGSSPASYITLVADAQAGVVDTTDGNSAVLTQLKQLDTPADKPANIDMPLGLISFVADVGTPGITETFSLYVDNSLPVNGYFKKNATGDWVNIATAVVGEFTKTRIDFAITDGGEFDADGLANGIITDPGAIGFQAKSLSFGETTFVEAAANNGLITTSSVITLINESFTGNTGDDWSSIVSNVPAGLTASLIRNDAAHATLSFTGQAEAHANVDDVSNLTVIFDDGKFTGGSAASVSGATTNNLLVDFADPPVNHGPTGTVTITGTPTQGQPLTATNDLADADGPAILTVTYQWQADGSEIVGANTSTLLLDQSLVGKTITVVARYLDAFNTAESQTSLATAAVNNSDDAATGTLLVTGTAAEGASLLASLSDVLDSDGSTSTSYRWQEEIASIWTDITGATTATLSIPADQSYVGKNVRVVATTLDVLGGSTEFIGNAQTIANINDAPTGSPVDTLPDGTEDTSYTVSAKTLLAGFMDIDGDSLSIANLTADHASVTDLGDGTWTLAPTNNYNGQVSLQFDVVDGNGGSIAATQQFVLLAVDDVAVVGSADVTVQETNAPLVINGVLSINDIDSPASFVAQPGSGGKYGTFTLGTDGAWSYKAKLAYDYLNIGDSLKDSFQVKTSDGTTSSVSVTIAGTADTTSVHLGDAPTAQSGTGGQWAQAWSQTGYAFLHKADHTNSVEAWSAVKLSGVSSQTLVGGDIYAGDLGVSGQSLLTSTIRQEIDGREALRVNLPTAADSVTVKLARLYANDDGGAFSESGLLRLLDAAGQVVAQTAFYADSVSGAKTVTLAAATGFTSMELIAGAYDGTGAFVYGAYSTTTGAFGSGSSMDTAGKFHGSDFLVDSMDFSVMLVGVDT